MGPCAMHHSFETFVMGNSSRKLEAEGERLKKQTKKNLAVQ